MVDDYTRFIWIWFLNTKDMKATSKAIREFKAQVENQFECKIKRCRSDNGTGEFANKEWKIIIAEAGIQHEPSPPDTQDRNGVAERAIRTLKEMATSLLVQAKLPPIFWAEAIATAVYIRNRVPTSASLTGLVPLFMAYPNLKEDQYSHLVPFGCLCFVIVPEDKQESFTSKTRVCLFLGYVWNSTTVYKVIDVATLYIFTTVQVRFDEEQFPGLPQITPNPNLSPLETKSRIPIGGFDKPGLSNQPISNEPAAKKPRIDSGDRSISNKEPARTRERKIGIPDRSRRPVDSGVKALSQKSDFEGSQVPGQLVVAKSPSASPSAYTVNTAHGLTVSVINLVSGLTYFDLVRDELLTSSMDEELNLFTLL